MPKNLTDVNSFDTIAVPVGTDAATAASVETPFQLLANRTRWLINFVYSVIASCYLNLHEADTSSISTFDLANVMAGYSRNSPEYRRTITLIDNDGETAISVDAGDASSPAEGGGGVLWDDETDTPNASLTWTAAATRVDICGVWYPDASLPSYPYRIAVSNSATGQVAYSSGIGTWTASASGVAGTAWSSCECGYNGTTFCWAIGGAGGAISTTSHPGSTAFTSRTSGLSGEVVRIRSNRKADSNHEMLALDDTGAVSVSNADGTTWSATASGSLGLTSTLESIAWDSLNDRWVGIQYNGYLAWSSDGSSWTESSDDNMPVFVANASNVFALDCDDHGNLILSIYRSGVRAYLYVAPYSGEGLDSGQVWEQAQFPELYTHAKIAFLAKGKIITAGSGGICYSDATFSTKSI